MEGSLGCIFTPEMLAAHWGQPVPLIRKMLNDGRIPHFRVGPRLPRVPIHFLEGRPFEYFFERPRAIARPGVEGQLTKKVRAELAKLHGEPAPQDFVYFVKCGKFVKIGFSECPAARMSGLLTGTPFDLELMGVMRGTRVAERIIHVCLQNRCHRREWFHLTPSIRRMIAELCR